MPGAVVGDKLIGRWVVPLKGTLRGIPPYTLPDDAVYDSLNVVVRDGGLTIRDGVKRLDSFDLGGRPVGAEAVLLMGTGAFQTDAFQNDAVQVGANTATSALIVVTPTKVWARMLDAWIDLTDTPLTAPSSRFARITAIQIGGGISAVITNGTDTPRVWDATTATVTPMAGSPPTWTDVCTASDRIVGIIPPYTVQWLGTLSLDATGTANNFRNLSDTIDEVVACRNLGTLGVVIYKQRSIWIGQPGFGVTDASYFAFTLRGKWDGPASPYAVVDADGAHYYMTDLGRIASFDGSTHAWIADGIWDPVKAELDLEFARQIYGVYNPIENEVTFYYPRIGDGGLLRGMVTVQLASATRQNVAAFRGRQTIPTSVGADTRLLTERQTLLFGDETHVTYHLDDGDGLDDGESFSGFWQPGFIVAPMFDLHRLEGFESYLERGQGYGALHVKVVTNNLLENPNGGTIAPSRTIDLSLTPPTQAEGANATGKFFTLRYEFTTPIQLRWYAARLAARRLEPDRREDRG